MVAGGYAECGGHAILYHGRVTELTNYWIRYANTQLGVPTMQDRSFCAHITILSYVTEMGTSVCSVEPCPRTLAGEVYN
jgi:hypothetical protein